MVIRNKERLVRGAPRQNVLVGFPTEIRAAVEEARLAEGELTRSPVSITEFVIKAVIERIGLVLGEGRANYLYRRYFNGIGFTNPANEPAIANPQPIGSVKPSPKPLFVVQCKENENE